MLHQNNSFGIMLNVFMMQCCNNSSFKALFIIDYVFFKAINYKTIQSIT